LSATPIPRRSLQDAIAADGGVSLEAYSNGNASNQPIAKLVANKETTAKAASAAKDALPGVNDMLAKARAEVARLEGVKFDAVIVFLKTRARDEHDTYIRAFRDLCDAYDRLCGIAVAVSATGRVGHDGLRAGGESSGARDGDSSHEHADS
jgi:hypothetical protein